MYHHHGLGQVSQQGQHGAGHGAPAQFATSDAVAVGPAGVTTTYIQVPQQQAVLLGPGTVFGVAGPGGFTVFPTSAGLLPAGVYASPHVSQLPHQQPYQGAGSGMGAAPQIMGGGAMPYGAHQSAHHPHLQHLQHHQQQMQQLSMQARPHAQHQHPHAHAMGGQQPMPLPQRRPGMRPQQPYDAGAGRQAAYAGSSPHPRQQGGTPGAYPHQQPPQQQQQQQQLQPSGAGPGSRGHSLAGPGAPALARGAGVQQGARPGARQGGPVYSSPPAADGASVSLEGLEVVSVGEALHQEISATNEGHGPARDAPGAAAAADHAAGASGSEATGTGGSSSAATSASAMAAAGRAGAAPQPLGGGGGAGFPQRGTAAASGSGSMLHATEAGPSPTERPAASAGTQIGGSVSKLVVASGAVHAIPQQQQQQQLYQQQPHPLTSPPGGPVLWSAGGGIMGGPAAVRPFPVVNVSSAFGDATASAAAAAAAAAAGMAGVSLGPGRAGGGGGAAAAAGLDHGGSTAMRALINWRGTFRSSLQPYEVLPPDHPGKGTEGLRELRLGALEVLVAETPDAANVAVETLRARMWDGVLAMATVERNDESDPIALLQLSAAGLALVMRPAACGGLPAAFRTAVVEDSDIELAVAGWNGSDERNFEESFGLQTFWCQITELPKVAKACGYSKTGIKALVQAVLEPAAAMPKSKKMGSHDWSSPTLPPEIIKQAVLDVACIEHVFRCLDGRF